MVFVHQSGGDCICNRCYRGDGSRSSGSSGRWDKYTALTDRDSGRDQTNYFSGTVGQRDQKKKVHVAIDDLGNVIYVRDEDGTVPYDKKNQLGHLLYDLNWSHN